MGGESTLVLLKEREEVYRANSKLKNNRYESSTHYRETTGEAFGVPVAQQLASTLSSEGFCNWPRPATQNLSPVPAMLPKINRVPKAVKIATVLAWVWMKIATVWRGGGFRPPQQW